MKISSPEIVQQHGNVLYRVSVDFSKGTQTLWYSLSAEFAALVCDRSDAALVALLIPAMVCGEDIYISGTVSEKLYYNLSVRYQHILQSLIPSLHLIKIYPSNVEPASYKAAGVATGFSAGIDSFSVLSDHHYKEVPLGFRVTHLLYNNVGSHDKGGEHLFIERYVRLKSFVKERIKLPFVAVNSNLNDFYGLNFQQTHTPRNVSVALLLQGGIGRYLYASGCGYANVFIGATHCMAYSDPITIPLLSTEALDAFSVGSEYTRVQKTLCVADIEDSYKTLDVCVGATNKAENCSTCVKCLRTLLTLEIAGMLDCYRDVFDLELYRRNRHSYITNMLQGNDFFFREIDAFAKEREFKFPLSSRWLASSSLVRQLAKPVRVARNFHRRMNKIL